MLQYFPGEGLAIGKGKPYSSYQGAQGNLPVLLPLLPLLRLTASAAQTCGTSRRRRRRKTLTMHEPRHRWLAGPDAVTVCCILAKICAAAGWSWFADCAKKTCLTRSRWARQHLCAANCSTSVQQVWLTQQASKSSLQALASAPTWRQSAGARSARLPALCSGCCACGGQAAAQPLRQSPQTCLGTGASG